MKRFLLGAIVTVVLVGLLAPAGVALADEPVAMSLTAGFDGKAKIGRWVPVDVELANSGPDVQGDLVFDVMAQGGPQQYVTRYQTAVSLPAGSHKHYRLYMLLGQGPNGLTVPKVDLMAGGKSLASAQPVVQMSPEVLVGVLGPDNSAVAGLASQEFPVGGRSVHLVHLDPEAIPEEGQALESLDAILVDNFAAAALSEGQRRALAGWTEQGGLLVLAGGPEAPKTLEPWAPWVPLTLEGQTRVAGSTLADFAGKPLAGPVEVSRVRIAGARTLLAEGGASLVAELTRGSGRVVYLAFDPGLEPVAGWNGLGTLWRKLLLRNLSADRMTNYQNQQSVFALQNMLSAAGNLPMSDLPSIRWFIVLVIAYILLVGPVNFFVLRKMRRAHLAWLTVPVLVLAFSGTTWALARQRGRDLITNSVSVLQLEPGATLATARTAVGVYTPAGTRNLLHLDQGALIQVMPANGPYFGGMPQQQGLENLPVGAAVKIGSGDVELKPIGIYSLRGVMTQGSVPVQGGIEGTLRFAEQGRLTGRLTNRTGMDLKGVAVVTGNGYQLLGDLAGSAGADVDFSATVGGGPQFGGPNPLLNSINRLYQVGGWGPEGPSRDQREMQRRQQIAMGAFQGGMVMDQPAYVLGWSDSSPTHFTVDGRDQQAFATTLVLQPLSLTAGPQPFEVPAGILSGRIVDWDGTGITNFGPGMLPLPADGSITLEFDLPLAAGASVDSLSLHLGWFKGGPMAGTTSLFDTGILNQRTGKWDDVDLKNDTAEISNTAGYISPTGQVRFRLKRHGKDQFPIGLPTLGFVGKGA